MNNCLIKSRHLSYKEVVHLGTIEKVKGSIINKLTRNNHSRIPFEIPRTAESKSDVFKDSRTILLSQAGSLQNDDTLDELLEHIYKERGRPETE